MFNAIDALDNQNQPVDSIKDDIDGYGSLLYGPQQSGVHNQWAGNITDFIMDKYNLDPYTDEIEANKRTSEDYQGSPPPVDDDWDPWEGEDEYGMTEEERIKDENEKMHLYGTLDPDQIKRHNKWAGRLAGGDNYAWRGIKQRIPGAFSELGEGLMGLSQNMTPFQYDEIGKDR